MFLSQKRLSRRTMLRAAGVTLALPLLESMSPRLFAAPVAKPRRFVGMMTNQGILPEFFFPKNSGAEYENTPYLDILKDHRKEMTVFSGVSLPGVDGGHASEMSFLTGAPGASRGTFKNTLSLDQFMAEKIGGETRFPSLALMVGSENLSLSWTRSGSMIPPITSPVKLYQQLFIEDTPAEKEAALKRLQQDRSLLDGLLDQYKKLQASSSAADKERLEQFATGVRDLEKRLAASESWIDKPKAKVTAPKPEAFSNHNDLRNNSKVMFDLVRLALETDSTRIVTICFNTTSLTPTIPGVKSQCHGLTHHGQRPEIVGELRKIEEVQFEGLSGFFASLKASKEEGVTLLDRTACLYGTNMGSANAHSTDNLPVLLAGGGFKHGQHLAFDRKNNYPLSNIYVSLLQRLGINANSFSSGNSTFRGLEQTG